MQINLNIFAKISQYNKHAGLKRSTQQLFITFDKIY